jgi:hypothetical protein
MPKGNEYAYGAGPGGGTGNMHGQIASPLQLCKHDITANSGSGQKGGEPNGPFGSYSQSSSPLPITTRDSLPGAPQQGFGNLGGAQARVVTPMDTAPTLPGVTGQSSGTGSTGGGKISSPFSSPWGESVGG